MLRQGQGYGAELELSHARRWEAPVAGGSSTHVGKPRLTPSAYNQLTTIITLSTNGQLHHTI